MNSSFLKYVKNSFGDNDVFTSCKDYIEPHIVPRLDHTKSYKVLSFGNVRFSNESYYVIYGKNQMFNIYRAILK